MSIKYADGSEFTGKHFAAALGIAAVLSMAAIPVIVARDNWKERRAMKKYWSQKAFTK